MIHLIQIIRNQQKLVWNSIWEHLFITDVLNSISVLFYNCSPCVTMEVVAVVLLEHKSWCLGRNNFKLAWFPGMSLTCRDYKFYDNILSNRVSWVLNIQTSNSWRKKCSLTMDSISRRQWRRCGSHFIYNVTKIDSWKHTVKTIWFQ